MSFRSNDELSNRTVGSRWKLNRPLHVAKGEFDAGSILRITKEADDRGEYSFVDEESGETVSFNFSNVDCSPYTPAMYCGLSPLARFTLLQDSQKAVIPISTPDNTVGELGFLRKFYENWCHGKPDSELKLDSEEWERKNGGKEQAKLTIKDFLGHGYVADWSVAEGREVERSMSALPTPPRMNISLVIKERAGIDYKNMGVIGGYTEFLEQEPMSTGDGRTTLRYQPVFHITVWKSVDSVPGLLAILLAAFAPSVYNSKFWLNQWRNFRQDGIHPGYLEKDPGFPFRPVMLKNSEELLSFADCYFNIPMIVIDAGGECDHTMGQQDVAAMLEELTRFLTIDGNPLIKPEFPFSRHFTNVGKRMVGNFKDHSGETQDSRQVDYFYIAEKWGWGAIDPHTREAFLSFSADPYNRVGITERVTGNFSPEYMVEEQLISPSFVKRLVEAVSNTGILLIDPTARELEPPFSKPEPVSF